MVDTASFAKLVPGFDFLQGLVKNAGASMPTIGQWVAPTLDPEELGKRIEQLRTVQFWLEQNAKMLGATIQALEVQRMTLSTLKTMNVQMTDLRDALMVKPGTADAASGPPAPAPKAAAPKAKPAQAKSPSGPASTAAATPPSLFASIDPTQAWSALTQQFTQIAANAMKDGASDAAKNLAGTMVKQSMDAANQTLKQAASVPAKVASAAGSAATTMAKAAVANVGRGATKPVTKSVTKAATKTAAKPIKQASSPTRKKATKAPKS